MLVFWGEQLDRAGVSHAKRVGDGVRDRVGAAGGRAPHDGTDVLRLELVVVAVDDETQSLGGAVVGDEAADVAAGWWPLIVVSTRRAKVSSSSWSGP